MYVIHENLECGTEHLVKWLKRKKSLMNCGICRGVGVLDLQSPPPLGVFIIACLLLPIQEVIAMFLNLRECPDYPWLEVLRS